MTGLGQSLRTPNLLWEENHGVTFPGQIAVVCRGGAEVSSTRLQSSLFNLRCSSQVGAWNVLSLRENGYLSLLSSEVKRLDIGIAALSEVELGF